MDKLEIMIVDDQPSICKEVAGFLKDAYIVHAFRNGNEALTYLEKHTVDLILLDYYMPEKTGFEVLLVLRQNKAFANTPVIFLTSEVNARMEHEMMQRGANGYLVKPVKPDELRRCVEKHLAEK